MTFFNVLAFLVLFFGFELRAANQSVLLLDDKINQLYELDNLESAFKDAIEKSETLYGATKTNEFISVCKQVVEQVRLAYIDSYKSYVLQSFEKRQNHKSRMLRLPQYLGNLFKKILTDVIKKKVLVFFDQDVLSSHQKDYAYILAHCICAKALKLYDMTGLMIDLALDARSVDDFRGLMHHAPSILRQRSEPEARGLRFLVFIILFSCGSYAILSEYNLPKQAVQSSPQAYGSLNAFTAQKQVLSNPRPTLLSLLSINSNR